jgi:hypothetical protein
MKMNKSLLAVAIATASFAGAVHADVELRFDGTENTIVLASEIFGDEALSGTAPTAVGGGTGGNETLVQMDVVTFDLNDAAVTLVSDGDNIDAGEKSSVKFTLGGDAVFGEDLSTTALVQAANGGSGAFSCTGGAVGAVAADDDLTDAACGATADSFVTWEVVQGGAIGDNTITIEFTAAAGAERSIGGLQFGNIKVKNLVAQLGDKGDHDDFRGKVELGIEYVEGTETTADTIVTTATDTPIVIFGSQPGLQLEGTATNFNVTTTGFLRINVGNGEKTFTDGGVGDDGRKDFDVAGDTNDVNLGTIQLKRQDIDAGDFPDAITGPGVVIKKEFGGDFDFQGGDKHRITISAGTGSFQVGSTIFLSTAACDLAQVTTLTSGGTLTVDSSTTTTISGTITGSTTALTTQYNLCYSTVNTAKIPEVGDISASWHVNFFNTRYDDQAYDKSAYGDLKRNGCIASFFNVPGVGENDTAFIRLTNTSNTNEGPVLATVYAQDGEMLVEDEEITSNLEQHATAVYTTLATNSENAYGQPLVSLADTLDDFTGTAELYKGRARVVLKGAFDTCEGLGLVKSGNGALINLTATTQGNGEGEGGNNGN